MSKVHEMADRMTDYLKTCGYKYVTFAQLSKNVEGFKGDLQITPTKYPTIVIWDGLSQEAFDAIVYLGEKLEMQPTHFLTYLHDGMYLNMPLAEKPYHYKKPHWSPTVIRYVGD